MQYFLRRTKLCRDKESYVETSVELLVLKWDRLFVVTGFLFVVTKLVLKGTHKKKFVATYLLYVATNNKLGPHKSCCDKNSICHDIIQLEHRQIYVVTVFAQWRQIITLIQN